jgi:hypothetical protein
VSSPSHALTSSYSASPSSGRLSICQRAVSGRVARRRRLLHALPTCRKADARRAEQALDVAYGVRVVGRTDEVRERFYAITIERRIKLHAARAISEFAREQLFG